MQIKNFIKNDESYLNSYTNITFEDNSVSFHLFKNDLIRVITNNNFLSAVEHFDYYELAVEIDHNAEINLVTRTKGSGFLKIKNISIDNLILFYSKLLELVNLQENDGFNNDGFKKFIEEELKQVEFLQQQIV